MFNLPIIYNGGGVKPCKASCIGNRRGAAMLVNMIIVALVMGLMATSFAQLSSGQFASAEAYRTSYQAQQLVEAKANEIAVTSYSALAAQARAVVTGATEWQREVVLGPEVDLGGGNRQRPVVISVYHGAEAVARASTVKYPTSAGTAAGVPSGTIAIWRGSVATIPDGWVLCDGANGTPDLRSRFVYGAGGDVNTKASYTNGWNAVNGHLNVGVIGGEEQHVLTWNEMPSHTHAGSTTTAGGAHTHGLLLAHPVGVSYSPITYYGSPAVYIPSATSPSSPGVINYGNRTTINGGDMWNVVANTTAFTNTGNSAHTHDLSISNAGGGVAHNILPRFITLAFIMKT